MELVEGLPKLELEPSHSASQSQLGLAAHNDDNGVLDIGLDVHALSEDEQDASSFRSVCCLYCIG